MLAVSRWFGLIKASDEDVDDEFEVSACVFVDVGSALIMSSDNLKKISGFELASLLQTIKFIKNVKIIYNKKRKKEISIT